MKHGPYGKTSATAGGGEPPPLRGRTPNARAGRVVNPRPLPGPWSFCLFCSARLTLDNLGRRIYTRSQSHWAALIFGVDLLRCSNRGVRQGRPSLRFSHLSRAAYGGVA